MLKALVGAAYNFTREAWMDNNNDTMQCIAMVEKIPIANKQTHSEKKR